LLSPQGQVNGNLTDFDYGELVQNCCGGTYMMRDSHGAKAAVFKPIDEVCPHLMPHLMPHLEHVVPLTITKPILCRRATLLLCRRARLCAELKRSTTTLTHPNTSY